MQYLTQRSCLFSQKTRWFDKPVTSPPASASTADAPCADVFCCGAPNPHTKAKEGHSDNPGSPPRATTAPGKCNPDHKPITRLLHLL